MLCYKDNILITSKNKEKHKHYLQQIFDRPRKHGLQINVAKCLLEVTEIKYLGYLTIILLTTREQSLFQKELKPSRHAIDPNPYAACTDS
jgi:hypothetical protein